MAWYAWFTCTGAETWNACVSPPLKHVQLFDFTRVYTCNGMWYVLETKHHLVWNSSNWLKCQLTVITALFDVFCFLFFPSVEECGLICVVYLRPYWNLECLHSLRTAKARRRSKFWPLKPQKRAVRRSSSFEELIFSVFGKILVLAIVFFQKPKWKSTENDYCSAVGKILALVNVLFWSNFKKR